MKDPKTAHGGLLAEYRNGNYVVTLYADGTKVKFTRDDFFVADFPDSIDLKITDRCDMNCPMCHENSRANGEHGRLDAPFLAALHRGTELAIGGGNPLSHPDLSAFLSEMKTRGAICNLTVNEKHFSDNTELLEKLLADKLVYGLGISVGECSKKLLDFAATHGTVVLHLICGMADEKLFAKLCDRLLKVLLLGYKKFGRGEKFYSAAVEKNIEWLKNNVAALSDRLAAMCFDNAAIEQLELKNSIPAPLFDARYMGDDGNGSMYIDLVKKQYAKSSTSRERFPLETSVDSMFAKIRTA
ncbi:MAG: radical SAM protein [Clostridia bacterium]|nr:radical SAM protein [Clostridia bacterium]